MFTCAIIYIKSIVDMSSRIFERLTDPLPDRHIWSGGASRNGKVYMGVYPTGQFCEYDIRTGSCEVYAPMPEGTRGVYVQGFSELPDGRILVGLDGAKPSFVIYNPVSQRIESIHNVDL